MQGKWLGEWSGRWFGDGEEAAPGQMAAYLYGSGSLQGELSADTGHGSFADMAATISGSGGLSATLSGGDEEVYYLAPVVRLRPKPKRIEEDEALLIALIM